MVGAKARLRTKRHLTVKKSTLPLSAWKSSLNPSRSLLSVLKTDQEVSKLGEDNFSVF